MCIIYIYHIYIHVPYIFIYISTSAYIYSSLNNRSIVPFVPSRCRPTKHEPKEDPTKALRKFTEKVGIYKFMHVKQIISEGI